MIIANPRFSSDIQNSVCSIDDHPEGEMMELDYCEPSDVGLDPNRFELIEQRCQQWIDEDIHQTLGVLVARHGRIAFHKAFGRRGPEAGPLELDSVFPVSSVSKPVVSTLAMMMVEDGLLNMAAPVRPYLPEMTGEGTDMISMLNLLTHTSGFSDEDSGPYTMERLKEPVNVGELDVSQHRTIERVLKVRWDMPVSFQPGTRMDYCAHNYDLAGEVLRRVSGKSLETLAQERLFQPLGMHDSSFRLLDQLRERVVKRNPVSELLFDLNDDKALDIPWASGGLKSTAPDLFCFGQLFLDGGVSDGRQLVSPPGIRELSRAQTPSDVRAYMYHPTFGEWDMGPASYGMGWFVQGDTKSGMNGMLQTRGTFAHSGMGGARLWVDPTYRMVCVVLTADSTPPTPGQFRHQQLQDMIMASIVEL
jgi:CubicO group peptidase (beta-lactamase class C family)